MGFVPHLLPLITTKTLVWGWYPVLVQTGPGSSAEPRETNIEKTGLDIVVLLRGPLCLSTRSSLGSLGFYFFVSLGGVLVSFKTCNAFRKVSCGERYCELSLS